MWPFGHFCPFQGFFIYNFACVIGNCINFGTGVYFYWNFTISLPFLLINLLYTRYTKLFLSAPFGQQCLHSNPLKLIFLITVLFNCKMMQFLLIGFHSVGKASKLNFLLFFTRFCQVWSIKQILALLLFSASGYYRVNWINNADIIVCVCVGMDVRVWFVCVVCVVCVCL